MTFKQKKLSSIETLGEKLMRHRTDGGVSIDKVAKLLGINKKYIKMMENDDYDNLPAQIYADNMLRRYAGFLELNPEMVMQLHEKEKKLYYKTINRKKAIIKDRSGLRYILDFILNPLTLKFSVVFLVTAMVLAYLGLSVNKIFAQPELIIKTPHEHSLITDKRTITLEGITEKEVELTINAKPVLSDEDGRFSLALDLQKGLNIIKITAKKKHSNPNIKYRQIIVSDGDNIDQLTENIINLQYQGDGS